MRPVSGPAMIRRVARISVVRDARAVDLRTVRPDEDATIAIVVLRLMIIVFMVSIGLIMVGFVLR